MKFIIAPAALDILDTVDIVRHVIGMCVDCHRVLVLFAHRHCLIPGARAHFLKPSAINQSARGATATRKQCAEKCAKLNQ